MSYFPFDKAWVRVKRTSRDKKVTISLMVAVSGQYDPGYPAPPCSDHDHPAFSDPGSPSDIEIDGIVEVEDVEIDCDEDELSKADQALLEAVVHAWDMQWRQSHAGNKAGANEHKQLAEWLEELFACRHGIGPWSHIEFTDKELRDLEEAAGEELADERQAAIEHKAEMDLEERRMRSRFGDDW